MEYRKQNFMMTSHQQKGFTLIELIVALSISALLAIYAQSELVKESEETLAEGAGIYLRQVSAGAERHMLLNYSQYSGALPIAGVAGVAVPLQPTVAELVALARLNPGFPSAAGSMPTRQNLQVNILRQNCPGATCQLIALTCTTTPVTLGGAFVRFDLAQTMVDMQDGSGGQSLQNVGNRIRGPVLDLANPYGNVEGIVCGSSVVDASFYARFVLMQDTRDPDLKGPLSVLGPVTLAGATTINNSATVNGALTTTGALTATSATITNGLTANNATITNALTANNATITNALTANNATITAGLSAASVTATGKSSGGMLSPTGLYAAGTACTAADDGSIGRRVGTTGLVVCQSLVWRPLTTAAEVGDACTVSGAAATNAAGAQMVCIGNKFISLATLFPVGVPGATCSNVGATALDTSNNNETLLCRANLSGGVARFMRLRDITQNLIFVDSFEVTDMSLGVSGMLLKPACTPAAGQPSTAVLQLVPKAFSTADGGVSAYAVDNGATWSVYLRNGLGAVLTGTPSATAIAHVYCYFP